MKSIVTVLIALTLSACASTMPMEGASTGQDRSAGLATLASFGTFEMELAPASTRLALARHRSAKALLADRIDVATAMEVQRRADEARSHLNNAYATMDALKQETPESRASLDDAMRIIYDIEQELLPR